MKKIVVVICLLLVFLMTSCSLSSVPSFEKMPYSHASITNFRSTVEWEISSYEVIGDFIRLKCANGYELLVSKNDCILYNLP